MLLDRTAEAIEAANSYRNDVDKRTNVHLLFCLFVTDRNFEVVDLLTAPPRASTGSHQTAKIPPNGCGFVVVQILVS
jgi:hypothetical protein